jgi:protein-S-isoprenylcysteine O-methyltransferase Ste14
MTAAPLDHGDTAGIVVRPPLLVLGALAVGFVIDYLWPLGLIGIAVPRATRIILGIGLFVAGGVLAAWAFEHFRRAGTKIPTSQPTLALVTGGPYRHSRNPIYTAMGIAFLGIALAADSVWLFALLIPVMVVLRYGVIAREEAYLARKFGEEYRRYTTSVRRWL